MFVVGERKNRFPLYLGVWFQSMPVSCKELKDQHLKENKLKRVRRE